MKIHHCLLGWSNKHNDVFNWMIHLYKNNITEFANNGPTSSFSLTQSPIQRGFFTLRNLVYHKKWGGMNQLMVLKCKNTLPKHMCYTRSKQIIKRDWNFLAELFVYSDSLVSRVFVLHYVFVYLYQFLKHLISKS